MKRSTMMTAAALLPTLALTSGCGFDFSIFLPNTITVTLVNESADFDVEATVIYDDQDLTFEDLLVQIGTEREFTIPPGESRSFFETCDDLQAIILSDADLQLIGGLGPEADSGVLRIDDDYDCGDQITFTFTHSALIVDFDVDVNVR